MWHHNDLDFYAHVKSDTFIPVLFCVEVLFCNVLIISLFLITTPVSFRTVSLTGAGSPLYSLTHTQEILP